MKKIKVICEHTDFENVGDCFKEALYACDCCNSPVCEKHLTKKCPYGGELYHELRGGENER